MSSITSPVLVCVCETEHWLLHCIFPWLFGSSDKSQQTGPWFPPQRTASLGFVAQAGECWLAEGSARPSLSGTHVPRCGLTLELWALSNHIWLMCLLVRGSVTPGLTLSFLAGACTQYELQVLINGQLVDATQTGDVAVTSYGVWWISHPVLLGC